HLAMKFPTQHEVGEVRGNQYDAQTCYKNSLKLAAKDATPCIIMVQLPREASGETLVEASIEMISEDLDPREINGKVKNGPIEDLEDLPFDRSSKILKIGAKL
ncbi:hypothetical protein PanWU01x14_304020, partial [Parasponia andersonii]